MTGSGSGLARLGGPIWLDVTRLLTRVGRGALSGIDRVELAYLRHLLTRAPDAQYLCRTTRGYLLLGISGGQHLVAMVTGETVPGRSDLWSRLTGRGKRWRHRAEAELRQFALARCAKTALPGLVSQEGPPALYLNTGHSSLTDETLAAFGPTPVVALVHDLIPVTHPHLVPEAQPATFAAKMDCIRRNARAVIANSDATAEDLTRHWGQGAPPIITAPLGIELPDRPLAEKEPRTIVMIGTIEPRKNHAVILEAWTRLAETMPPDAMPHLHIIGAIGWRGEAVLRAIQTHPQHGKTITFHGPLPDAEASAILARAGAMLYPTLAEGFGLPPFEALSYRARPIVSDLPVLRAGLGAHAVYVSPTDAYAWMETIKQYLAGSLPMPDTGLTLPDWQSHFERVASGLAPVVAGTEREG